MSPIIQTNSETTPAATAGQTAAQAAAGPLGNDHGRSD